MSNQKLLNEIIRLLGTNSNIASATNCMTRLRVKVKNEELVDKDAIKKIDGVMGLVEDETIQIVVGPGKAGKLMELYNELYADNATPTNNWEENKSKIKGNQKQSKFKQSLRVIGEIFIPLLPAIIAAGLFNGFAGLITNLQKTEILADTALLNNIRLMLSLMGGAFLSYFTVFVGINSAKKFGATEALGGMIGAMTVMGQINDISMNLGLYNVESPLNSTLRSGKGGVIGVILGVWILAKVEKAVRKRMPDVLDLILTPVISLIIMSIALIAVIMPLSGFFSDGLVAVLEALVNSSSPVVSVISGYVLAALFLPMVLLGLHHGLIPIYFVQLEQMGGVTLFPVLAMAGAGQVGAAIAIYLKAKATENHYLKRIISGALPAGFLGIGEPLIYGVTLPMGKPFITAGLGAGFGGAYIMLTHVIANSWGPSGITAIPLMSDPNSMLNYFIGLVISYIGGFGMTLLFISKDDVASVDGN
ncbi:PTS transporter subunit EIIC [Clostridiaceae bacterium HSG29]|nr:PTS transporter subunit EIIC [Clostridiaceae bacterium HSG29]